MKVRYRKQRIPRPRLVSIGILVGRARRQKSFWTQGNPTQRRIMQVSRELMAELIASWRAKEGEQKEEKGEGQEQPA